MKIVKLNAINSTNNFLKDLVSRSRVENWTVIVTENQTSGRGQFKNEWFSEKGKNLTFSILCKFANFDIANAFYLNCAVSIAIFNVLNRYIPSELFVKWPNDILSFKKKLCGILIENTVSNTKIQQSIIGIGLNVNQLNFPKSLTNATSLKLINNHSFDRDNLLKLIVNEIKKQTSFIEKQKFRLLKETYENVLYKKGIPSMFKNTNNEQFMGKILGISKQGKLLVELENEQIMTFDLKEIKFI